MPSSSSCQLRGCATLRPGSSVCHCALCHQTFGTLGMFDIHQRMRSGAISCKSPERLGLVQAPNGTWWTPGRLTDITEKVARMDSARRRS